MDLESRAEFSLNLGGASEIDVRAINGMSSSVAEIIKHTTSNLSPDSQSRIMIKAPEKGSINFEFAAIVVPLYPQLFEGAKLAVEVVNICFELVKIKKHLKGAKPNSIAEGKVENVDGEKLSAQDKRSVDLYFKDSHIEKQVINIFNFAQESNRDSLSLRRGEEIVEIKRESFPQMKTSVVEDKPKDIMRQQVTMRLHLKKPDLLGNSKWSFVSDKAFDAEMRDEEFRGKVHKGEIRDLYAGVQMDCELLIETEYDENKNPLNTKYSVMKVIGDIIKPAEEGTLM